MPKESVMIRAMALCWVVDVGCRNEAVSGKLLHQLDHIPARNMELLSKMIEGGPCITLAARKVSQVSVELLRLLGNLRALSSHCGSHTP